MGAAQARAVRCRDGDLAGRSSDAAESGGRGDLIEAIAQVVADTRQRTNPLHDFTPKGALPGQELLEELAEVLVPPA